MPLYASLAAPYRPKIINECTSEPLTVFESLFKNSNQCRLIISIRHTLSGYRISLIRSVDTMKIGLTSKQALGAHKSQRELIMTRILSQPTNGIYCLFDCLLTLVILANLAR